MRTYQKNYNLDVGGSPVTFTMSVTIQEDVKLKYIVSISSSDNVLIEKFSTTEESEVLPKVAEFEALASSYSDGSYTKSDLENSLITDSFKLSKL